MGPMTPPGKPSNHLFGSLLHHRCFPHKFFLESLGQVELRPKTITCDGLMTVFLVPSLAMGSQVVYIVRVSSEILAGGKKR